MKSDPISSLRECEAETFKAYLEWRVKNFRIKKQSTIQMYWRRILCKYIDVAGHSMNNGAELDVQDVRKCAVTFSQTSLLKDPQWIPTYLTPIHSLDTCEKEKHAMSVRDLYVILHAHWTRDTRPCHGRFRVEISLLLLLSVATATRPGALVESGSAKHSNKALSYEHVSIMRVRDVTNPDRTTTVAKVDLVHIKSSGGKGRRSESSNKPGPNRANNSFSKKFIFRLESIPAFCIVSYIISLAIADNAFRYHLTSVEEVFNYTIPAHKECLKLQFRKEIENRPIFRNAEKRCRGGQISETKALPYQKCRDHFVWLGRLAGFEQSLEFYQLRRASGRKLNCEWTA